MEKIIDYCIVSEEYTHDLYTEVLKLIKNGRQPIGGISHLRKYDRAHYCQAMVIYEKKSFKP